MFLIKDEEADGSEVSVWPSVFKEKDDSNSRRRFFMALYYLCHVEKRELALNILLVRLYTHFSERNLVRKLHSRPAH